MHHCKSTKLSTETNPVPQFLNEMCIYCNIGPKQEWNSALNHVPHMHVPFQRSIVLHLSKEGIPVYGDVMWAWHAIWSNDLYYSYFKSLQKPLSYVTMTRQMDEHYVLGKYWNNHDGNQMAKWLQGLKFGINRADCYRQSLIFSKWGHPC